MCMVYKLIYEHIEKFAFVFHTITSVKVFIVINSKYKLAKDFHDIMKKYIVLELKLLLFSSDILADIKIYSNEVRYMRI